MLDLVNDLVLGIGNVLGGFDGVDVCVLGIRGGNGAGGLPGTVLGLALGLGAGLEIDLCICNGGTVFGLDLGLGFGLVLRQDFGLGLR